MRSPSDYNRGLYPSDENFRILYAGIFRSRCLYAEYISRDIDAREIPDRVKQAVQKLQSGNINKTSARRSYVYEDNAFYLDLESDVCLVCVCKQEVQSHLVLSFLRTLRAEYEKLGNMINQAVATRILIELVDSSEQGGLGAQRIHRVQQELDAVTYLVKDNINSVLERSEQIECLVGKTTNLRDTAFQFRNSATRLKRRLWWSTARTYVLFLLLFAGLVLVIFYALHR